jgi:hypothetical protein
MYNNLQVIKHAAKNSASFSVIVRAACHPKSADGSNQPAKTSLSKA